MDEESRLTRAFQARAAQIHEEAGHIADPEIKHALLNIAAHYDQLAKRVAKRRLSK